MGQNQKKALAVFFPGIGYTNDKPLLYYSRKLTAEIGCEELILEYHDLPGKVRGDAALLKKTAEIAYSQVQEALDPIKFDSYERVIFVGKSIGTALAAAYASEKVPQAQLVLYTPVEQTFACSLPHAAAFLGDQDPWSDFDTMKRLAAERGVPLYVYEGCNHSLERQGKTEENIQILADVMKKTNIFLNGEGKS